MRRWGFVAFFGAVAAACGLSVQGTASDSSGADASALDGTIDSNQFTDALSGVDANDSSADASFDASSFDAGNTDGSACVDAGPVGENGVMTGIRSTTTHVTNGNFDEWTCAPLFTMDSTTAGRVRGTTDDVAQFAVEWDDTGIYFAVHVSDTPVEGNDTNDPYKNDAVDLYLAGAPTDGANNSDTFHVIVDYKNLAKQYSGGPAMTPPLGFASAATLVSDGYNIEMFVPKAAFGVSTMSASTIGFDVQVDDNDGSAQTGVLWFSNPATLPDVGECGAAMTEPACDTYAYGKVVLTP